MAPMCQDNGASSWLHTLSWTSTPPLAHSTQAHYCACICDSFKTPKGTEFILELAQPEPPSQCDSPSRICPHSANTDSLSSSNSRIHRALSSPFTNHRPARWPQMAGTIATGMQLCVPTFTQTQKGIDPILSGPRLQTSDII